MLQTKSAGAPPAMSAVWTLLKPFSRNCRTTSPPMLPLPMTSAVDSAGALMIGFATGAEPAAAAAAAAVASVFLPCKWLNTSSPKAFGAPGSPPNQVLPVAVPSTDSTYMAATTARGTVFSVGCPAASAVSVTVVGATAFSRMPRGASIPAQRTKASSAAQFAEMAGQLLLVVRAARPEVMVTLPPSRTSLSSLPLMSKSAVLDTQSNLLWKFSYQAFPSKREMSPKDECPAQMTTWSTPPGIAGPRASTLSKSCMFTLKSALSAISAV
mmetsp:Transcript_85443/g.217821  ORF Transcript_85443/g.217821 Transcript_85443/m.217821 type:complete len:269 (-) Transcript_85443:116-922(-)